MRERLWIWSPDPVLEKLRIRIRILFFLRSWTRIRTISDRIRNPAGNIFNIIKNYDDENNNSNNYSNNHIIIYYNDNNKNNKNNYSNDKYRNILFFQILFISRPTTPFSDHSSFQKSNLRYNIFLVQGVQKRLWLCSIFCISSWPEIFPQTR